MGKIAKIHGPYQLPQVRLKTRLITFDDRLRQVRVIHKSGRKSPVVPSQNGYDGMIEFYPYTSKKGLMYIQRYRPSWSSGRL